MVDYNYMSDVQCSPRNSNTHTMNFLLFLKLSLSLHTHNTRNSNGVAWIIRSGVSLEYGEN